VKRPTTVVAVFAPLFCLVLGLAIASVPAPPARAVEGPCYIWQAMIDQMSSSVQFVTQVIQTGGCGAGPTIDVMAHMKKTGTIHGSDWRERSWGLLWNHKFSSTSEGSARVAQDDSIPWIADFRVWGQGNRASFSGQATVMDQTHYMEPTQHWGEENNFQLQGKYPMALVTSMGDRAPESGAWVSEQRVGVYLSLTQSDPVGTIVECQVIFDPIIFVDPEWEHASEWVVLSQAKPDSDAWEVATRDWMTIWTDVTPPELANMNGALSWGDYDQDGDPDLFAAWGIGTGSHLFRNDGPGTFVELTGSALTGLPIARVGAWADYDNDGDLDIFVGMDKSPCKLFRNDGGDVFVDVTPPAIALSEGMTSAGWADYDLDGDVDLYQVIYDGWSSPTATNHLVRNDGDGAFTDVTSGAVALRGPCTSVAWGDYDNDGDPDLYICGWTQKLLRNDGSVFTDVTPGWIAEGFGFFRSAGWADYDNDGLLDLMGTNYGAGAGLYRNLGGGAFADSTSVLRALHNNAETMALGDVDNNGYIDMNVIAADTSGQLLCNFGQFFLSGITVTLGEPPNVPGAVTASLVDYDLDGDLDIFAGGGAGGGTLFQNDGQQLNHWVRIRPHGVASNRSGIGARVRVVAGGRQQIREVSASTRKNSGDPLEPWFGLSDAATIDTLEIRWPSGTVDVSTDVAADRSIIVTEGTGISGVPVPRADSRVFLYPSYPSPSGHYATIRFYLSSTERVGLEIYDVAGRRVRKLIDGVPLDSGVCTMVWDGLGEDGARVAAGVYFCRLQAAGEVQTTKIVIVR